MIQEQAQQNIKDYVQIVKNRKNIFFLFFISVVVIVTLGSFLMPPVYRSEVVLLVDLESPNVLTTSGSVELGVSNYYAYKEYFQTQSKIIKSRNILTQVFNEFGLNKEAKYANAKDPISGFIKTVKVEPIRDTRLMSLSVENESSKLAADIANRIAEIYVNKNLSLISKSEVLDLYKNEYLKLEARLSEYSKIYKHKHPKMIRLKTEIAQMAEKIKEERDRADPGLSASGKDESISGALLSGLKSNNVTIQDFAEIEVLPVRPKKRINILLAILVGFFGGIALTFFAEYLDNTIKDIKDIQQYVKWPFLGCIPNMDKICKADEFEKDLFVYKQPKDPVSEAYRTIRTSVQFSSTEEHSIKTILITSPGPQEGKTTTLCNLGLTLGQANMKILLVDADLRKSRLHEIFKTKNDIGLSNFLSGQAIFKKVVKKTEIENVSIVCSGPYPPNPSELLASRKMEDFIAKSVSDFDFVIFDTAPIAVVTDAVILSRIVDGTILVFESGKTNKELTPRIDQMLKDAQSSVLGVIMNKAAISGGGYQYYAKYYGETPQ